MSRKKHPDMVAKITRQYDAQHYVTEEVSCDEQG